jgi:hypothetical protein
LGLKEVESTKDADSSTLLSSFQEGRSAPAKVGTLLPGDLMPPWIFPGKMTERSAAPL